MARIVVDPFATQSQPKEQNLKVESSHTSEISSDNCEIDLVSIASSDTSSYNNPRSPISNEPMVLVECGPHNLPKFKVWAHLRDRIVLPYRE